MSGPADSSERPRFRRSRAGLDSDVQDLLKRIDMMIFERIFAGLPEIILRRLGADEFRLAEEIFFSPKGPERDRARDDLFAAVKRIAVTCDATRERRRTSRAGKRAESAKREGER